MPQRFGQASDYGQTFQYLADRNYDLLRSRAEEYDRGREEERAAKDALMFERYEQGQMSGAEILAYIRQRIAQTGYDLAQQRQWKQALVQYGGAVADNAAEAAYEESGNIHALIAHYAQRTAAAAKGSPARTELAQRLSQLREQRDSDSLRRGVRRIANQIQSGKSSTKDLIEFYKAQLDKLPPGSPLRSEVRDALSQARAQRQQELFTVAMQKVDTQYDTSAITPTEAARQKQAILDQYDIKNIDPVVYWQYQDAIRKLKATPDPTQIAKWEFMVSNGEMSIGDFQNKLLDYADRLEPFDPLAAWNMRNTAIAGLEGATPLPNPMRGGANAAKRIAFTTQMDGSTYASLNCTMAAGAMLGYALGVKDLSGGDLRYLTGDTSGGTTLAQLQQALVQSGVGAGKLSYKTGMDFDRFKRRVANGAPAVLSGFNGDIPAKFNSSGIIAGHGMFVAGYSAKKDAFLMLDPAKSSDDGTWWPSSVVESFGWGNGDGAHFGNVLLAPTGTINPASLANLKNIRTIHSSVWSPPKRRITPPQYTGQFYAGPHEKTTAVQGEKNRRSVEQRRISRRAERAGIAEETDTVEEAQAELVRREGLYSDAAKYIDEWIRQYANDPEQESFDITIGTVTKTFNKEDITALQRDTLYVLDGEEFLYKELNDVDGINRIGNLKLDIIKNAAIANTMVQDEAENRVYREYSSRLPYIAMTNDPSGIAKFFMDFSEDILAVQPEETEAKEDPLASETDIDASAIGTIMEPQEAGESASIAQLVDAINNPDMSPEERDDLLVTVAESMGIELPKGWPDDPQPTPDQIGTQGDTWATMVSTANDHWLVENKEAAWVVKTTPGGPGYGPVGTLVALPTMQTGGIDSTGQRAEGAVQATTEDGVEGQYGTGARVLINLAGQNAAGYSSSEDLPIVTLFTPSGPLKVPAIPTLVPYAGVEFLQVKDASALDAAGINTRDGQHVFGGYLTDDAIAILEASGKTNELVRSGMLTVQPWIVESITLPTWKDQLGKFHPGGNTWFRYPGSDGWTREGLPFTASERTIGDHSFGTSYNGVDPEKSTAGNPMPARTLDIDEMDPSTTPVISPYHTSDESVGVGFEVGVTKQQMEAFRLQGLLSKPQTGMMPGSDGELTPGQPSYTNFMDLAVKLNQEREAEQKRLQEAEIQRNLEGNTARANEYATLGIVQERTSVVDQMFNVENALGTERSTREEPPATTIPSPKKAWDIKYPEPKEPTPRDSILYKPPKAKAPKVDLPQAKDFDIKNYIDQPGRSPIPAPKPLPAPKPKPKPVQETDNWRNTQGTTPGGGR